MARWDDKDAKIVNDSIIENYIAKQRAEKSTGNAGSVYVMGRYHKADQKEYSGSTRIKLAVQR